MSPAFRVALVPCSGPVASLMRAACAPSGQAFVVTHDHAAHHRWLLPSCLSSSILQTKGQAATTCHERRWYSTCAGATAPAQHLSCVCLYRVFAHFSGPLPALVMHATAASQHRHGCCDEFSTACECVCFCVDVCMCARARVRLCHV